MKKPIVLDTERLILREMNQEDLASLGNIMKDPQVMYAYNGPFSDGEVQQWLDRQIERYADDGIGLWAVILKDTGTMIGQCGLTIQPWKDQRVLEVGYLFAKAYWHHGYCTEAAAACMNHAFEEMNADAVYSIIRDTNTASRNVAIRNGMQVTDTWTKHYRGIDMPHVLYCRKKA